MTTSAASPLRTAVLTAFALAAFAANSLLCRVALGGGTIDAASFAAVRLLSGAAALALLLRVRGSRQGGSWREGAALALYAVAFSLAYVSLAVGTGALLLFAAVQMTMVGAGIAAGERPHALEWLGLVSAIAGLVVLVAPRLQRPPLAAALAMALAGVAWGVYTLLGRDAPDPIAATAGNFARALPVAAIGILAALALSSVHLTLPGALLAMISGAITSGLGYAIWYAALPGLTAARAALVQLAVPLLAAAGGVLFLREPITAPLVAAAVLIGGGLALAGRAPRRPPASDSG